MCLTFLALSVFASISLLSNLSSSLEELISLAFPLCSSQRCVYKLRRTMNHCAVQQQNAFNNTCDDMRSSVSVSAYAFGADRKETVVCPKPRRLGQLSSAGVYDPIRALRWHVSHQPELIEAKAGADLLDIILPKGGYGGEQSCPQVASSPPFFCGSPPSRVSNPLIQDARFGDEKFLPISPSSIPVPSGLSSSPSSSSRKGGCVRANFGNNPAVRVEGFDCLDRDSRNCSIPALA